MARMRAADFEEKRHSILISAAAVFAEQGLEKASMSQIAAHNSVSKALLYHYYPSKGALIFAIISTHLNKLDDAIAAAEDASLPPPERLRKMVGTILKAYRGAGNQHNLKLNAMPALTGEQRAAITVIERRITKRFSSVLREISPQLDNKERPLLMPVTMSLFGMLNWVYLWFKEGGAITRDDYAEVATTLILEGIKKVR